MKKNSKPFVGLTPYQIGIPPAGYGFLYLNLEALERMTHQEAIAKLESMGYKPRLRYQETLKGLEVCALLSVAKLDRSTSLDAPFEDVLEDLFEIFGNAIRAPFGLSRKDCETLGVDPDYLDPKCLEEEAIALV
ncbi:MULTISPECIES: hypothetical protein [Spirulina sp. CCY15215]|uniref:hypothetical protein n=1 Tax=Spirulina sp. CCY15215 TaxID=2767591 RepID=UPI001952516A|nr:hypothetical protein [Spirulina major]